MRIAFIGVSFWGTVILFEGKGSIPPFFCWHISVLSILLMFRLFKSCEENSPHPIRSAVFDPELRPKGAHDEALPLSFDPRLSTGRGRGGRG